MSSNWNARAVEDGLAGTRFAGKVIHLATTGSTNTLAIEAAQAGEPEGMVWVADEQTAGRGRGGHGWHSAAGDGLYVSVLLRPRMVLAEALWLSLATGLAVQAAVEEVTGATPDIRWPNDMMLNGRKFGGILAETSASSNALRYAVVGIGLNIQHAAFPPELRGIATSLRLETGQEWPREALLVALLRALDREVDRLEAGEATLLERFSRASSWARGKAVQVGEDEGRDRYTGMTAGLDARGFLLVRTADGSLRTVLSGGVRPH
jgi:BirA family biotin operon repressor/biotin-[acetyl-CoA-carboxylase] ligase